MVFSVKANKKRIIAVLVVIAILVCAVIVLPKMMTAPMKHYGETPAQRTEFLRSYGWEIAEEPIDSREVTIPKTFNEVYAKYNVMQKAQGFDLKSYSGLVCDQYIYLIENYPNTDREIHATLLVYEGLIIGGDLACAEVDGFMHGFAADSARYGEEPVKKQEALPESKAPADSAAPAESAAESAAQTGGELLGEPGEEETATEPITEDTEEAAVDKPVDTEILEEDYPTD